MNQHHDPILIAHRKSWALLQRTFVQGDGTQAPGFVTLCYTNNPPQPYVVHFFNCQDGGFHSGNYAATETEAMAFYDSRCQRFKVSPDYR